MDAQRVADTRPSKELTMLEITHVLRERSTCNRLHVGAIVTDPGMTTILGIGYNGTARGLPNGCDRETVGDCGCVHAEANALLKCTYAQLLGSRLFTTTTPCSDCAKLIINAGCADVFAGERYRSDSGVVLLLTARIRVMLYTGDDMWSNMDDIVNAELGTDVF